MECHGVKNVWSAKFFSCPSENSETHTVPHTNTHTYTHTHTNVHQKIHFYMLQDRHRLYLTHTLDRVCTCHNKKSLIDHRTHIHGKTQTCTFQNTYTLMNTTTQDKRLTWLRALTHQKINLPTHYRMCKHIQKYAQGHLYTLYSIHTSKKIHTCSRRILYQPGHYAHRKYKIHHP